MITIKVDKAILEQIENEYKDYIVNRNIGYIIFVAKTPTNIITAYENKKGVKLSKSEKGGCYER